MSTSSPSAEQTVQLTEERILSVLHSGQMEERGLLPYSSNYSFLVTVTEEEIDLAAVYKPRRGENPLWDFTSGTLCQREVAAYLVSNTLGWDLVPPTVLREGAHGTGSVQLFVHHDANEHYFTFQEDARFATALRRLSLFDYLVNNADRKSGHCLAGDDQRLWAIDHGICFHDEYKLRTVIWEYSNEEIEDAHYHDLDALSQRLAEPQNDFCSTLQSLISVAEFRALQERLHTLLQSRAYPSPSPYVRNYPWPPV